MLFRFRSHAISQALVVSLILFGSLLAHAQAAIDLGEAAGDPIKLFQHGQDAHARKDYQLALKLYEEALKLKPEFPEAEYQRGQALLSLGQAVEAEKAFRRAVELRPDWALPYVALGSQLLRARHEAEAETILGKALELDSRSSRALVGLASELRSQPQIYQNSLAVLLRLLQQVSDDKNPTSEYWTARGLTEEALGKKTEALSSYQRAVNLDAQNYQALAARAQLRANTGDQEGALTDIQAARRLVPNDAQVKLQSISIYLQAGRKEEARRDWEALDSTIKALPEAAALQGAMLSCEETPENRAALEKAVAAAPRDAQLLACLGTAYRRADPSRSLEFYRRAAAIEPQNIDLAVGYTAALVQARRFDEAAIIARRVLAIAPDRYEAHTNLATALYELKRYAEALVEFRWLAEAKPDLAVTYFFIATAHDFLGEYAAALTAYETFLARAGAQANQLEIEKVNLRLPTLRNQIKRGEGAKQKKENNREQ
jgi:tetratricopeptide (TPR) repeat protein